MRVGWDAWVLVWVGGQSLAPHPCPCVLPLPPSSLPCLRSELDLGFQLLSDEGSKGERRRCLLGAHPVICCALPLPCGCCSSKCRLAAAAPSACIPSRSPPDPQLICPHPRAPTHARPDHCCHLKPTPLPSTPPHHPAVRALYGVPTDLFGLLPGRVTYVIGKDGLVKLVFNSQVCACLLLGWGSGHALAA